MIDEEDNWIIIRATSDPAVYPTFKEDIFRSFLNELDVVPEELRESSDEFQGIDSSPDDAPPADSEATPTDEPVDGAQPQPTYTSQPTYTPLPTYTQPAG